MSILSYFLPSFCSPIIPPSPACLSLRVRHSLAHERPLAFTVSGPLTERRLAMEGPCRRPILGWTASILLQALPHLANAQAPPPSSSAPSPPASSSMAPFPEDDLEDNSSRSSFTSQYIVLVVLALFILSLSFWMFFRKKSLWVPARCNGRASNGQTSIQLRARFRPWPRRVDEGLDERGEAPPPYVSGGADASLGKPPDYQPNPDFETHDLTRPAPTHPPSYHANSPV